MILDAFRGLALLGIALANFPEFALWTFLSDDEQQAMATACAYIEENLDDDVVEEIYDWFKEEAASDSLEDAIAALGSDYEDLEIRLVRIKFLCEVAN